MVGSDFAPKLVSEREATLGSPWAPIYLLADVARYTRLPSSVARRWVDWIPGRNGVSERRTGLCFLDLISMLVMHEIRQYGVRPSRIRRAEHYLTRMLGPYPLAQSNIWTDGYHILFNPESPLSSEVTPSALVSADRGGQSAFVELLQQYLHHIDYSPQGYATAWYPTNRVVLDPARQFGQPCVVGTRVPTRAIFLLSGAGDTKEAIARSFGIPLEDVEEALEWEANLERRAA